MKKKLLFFALAAFVISSCTNDQVVPNLDKGDNTIKFSTYVNKPTKSTVLTNSNFSMFLLNGCKSATAIDWATVPSALITSTVLRTPGGANDSWYTIPVYWPGVGTHAIFYGYFPPNGAVYAATASTGPTLTITNTSQSDYIVGKSDDITVPAVGEYTRVAIPFKHIMSKISFSAQAVPGITVSIHSVEIEGLNTVATYNFNSGTWGSVTTAGPHAAILSTDPFVVNSITPASIVASNGSIIAIPQTKAAWSGLPSTFDPATQCRLKMTYRMKNNADDSYVVGSASTYGEAYLPIALNLVEGNSYTITLKFGDGSSITGGGGYDSSGNPLINTGNTIKFSTTFTDTWTDNTATTSQM